MSATQKVNELLKASGAELVRSRKHEVWRLPNGRNFVRAKTPSDANEDRNNLQDLRKALGETNQGRGEGERRPKRAKGRKAATVVDAPRTPALTGSLAAQLRATGVVEMAEAEKARRWARVWKRKAKALADGLRIANYRADYMRAELARPCPCWWCRVKARFTR